MLLELENVSASFADISYCATGGDHEALVRDARTDRELRDFDVANSSVFCGRCHCLIPLECRVL